MLWQAVQRLGRNRGEFRGSRVWLLAAREGIGTGGTTVCLISLVAARRQIGAVMTNETAGMFALEKFIR
jgi:hypothetical protein